MEHHVGNEHTSRFWSEHCNEIVRRICDLYPDNFAPVCQLPQSPGVSIDSSVRELRRCVEEMGFVGCNLNPDPSGGMWNGPTLSDRDYWPLYEALCELDVPAMIHVSATCNPHFHSTGSHYLGSDTTAFMQAMTSGLFRDFPQMRWVIPHGGGAVPYHWGRFKGMAEENVGAGWHTLDELMDNVWFDTCVYHQPGIDLLLEVVPIANILFASEMVGAVKGTNPDTGEYYDDTRKYVDRAELDDEQRRQIFELQRAACLPTHRRSEPDMNRPDTNRHVIVRTIERAIAPWSTNWASRHGHRARGDRSRRLRRTAAAPDPARRAHRRQCRHRAQPSRRQHHDPRRGRGLRGG